jgi:trimethylamine--corrinoid protein Co-methyltransferase
VKRRSTAPPPEAPAPLSARGVSSIHEASLAVLANTGMRFASPAALELFRGRGFRLDGQRVFFDEKRILQALDSVPSRFTILARNPRRDRLLEPGAAAFGLGRGAVTWVEPDGQHRPGTRGDMVAVTKLFHRLDVLDFWGPLIHPADIEAVNAEIWARWMMIKLTDKPYLYSSADHIDLIALAYGTSRKQMADRSDFERSHGQATAMVVSPLSMSAQDCDDLIEYARCGIAFHIASMPVAGTSAPCTLAGLVVLQNCENLGPIVLSQLVRPGCPVFYGAIGGLSDMRSLRPLFGTVETRLIERAGMQMARSYGLLCRGGVGLTDAPACDFQAGAQAMLHALQAVREGPEFLPGCGLLGSYLGASLAKVVLDAELIALARRFLEPIRIDPESLAVDVIAEVGPGGHFVEHPHTLQHFRAELVSDTIFQAADYDRWAAGGRQQVVHRAHEKALRLIEGYQPPALDQALEAELDGYMQRRLGRRPAL